MTAMTDYKELTKDQKEIIARAQDEFMIDEIMPGRVEQQARRRLLSAIRRLRSGLRDNIPKPIIESQFKVLIDALKPYDKWRKERVKGAGGGINEEYLTDPQKEKLQKVIKLIDFCIGPPTSDLIEFDLLLGAYDEYLFWKEEPFCYTDKFIDDLINNLDVYAKRVVGRMARNMVDDIFGKGSGSKI